MVSWKQCLSDNQAWDTLTWFAALIAMASYLNKYGFIGWFSDQVRRLHPHCLPPFSSVLVVMLLGRFVHRPSVRPLTLSAPPPPPCPPSAQVVGLVGGMGMSWQATFGVILSLYFYSHYFFASGESLCHY